MTNTTLQVKGMTCDHCKATVEKKLRTIPGAQNIDVDRFQGIASLDWDESKASRDDIVAAVNEIGFQAS